MNKLPLLHEFFLEIWNEWIDNTAQSDGHCKQNFFSEGETKKKICIRKSQIKLTEQCFKFFEPQNCVADQEVLIAHRIKEKLRGEKKNIGRNYCWNFFKKQF